MFPQDLELSSLFLVQLHIILIPCLGGWGSRMFIATTLIIVYRHHFNNRLWFLKNKRLFLAGILKMNKYKISYKITYQKKCLIKSLSKRKKKRWKFEIKQLQLGGTSHNVLKGEPSESCSVSCLACDLIEHKTYLYRSYIHIFL